MQILDTANFSRRDWLETAGILGKIGIERPRGGWGNVRWPAGDDRSESARERETRPGRGPSFYRRRRRHRCTECGWRLDGETERNEEDGIWAVFV